MIILSIETSCDDTSVAIIKFEKNKTEILSNCVSSQIKIHEKFGGVVPNLAAREHLKNIFPLLKLAFKESGLTYNDIDLIAVTNGPGLIPALLIGTNVAKTLSYAWGKPLIGIHHIEGHIYANFVEISNFQFSIFKQSIDTKYEIQFPILALVVSGGHTQLIYMRKHLDYEIIGQTLDDAAGEAFDKVARILGLGYPGGPAVAAKAAVFKTQNLKCEINLPRPLLNRNNFDFSFSGLKTAVLYETKKNFHLLKNTTYIGKICHGFQQAVIDVLIKKTLKAAKRYGPKTILLAGGVSANQELRKQLGEAIQREMQGVDYRVPDMKYSVDNAAMIASAAYFRWKNMAPEEQKKALQNWKDLETDANLKLK